MANKAQEVRIHKALSDSGIVSRRKAEELIAQGKVTVNGHPATIGQKIVPGRDNVMIEGRRVTFETHKKNYYIVLNKPRGYVTTLDDELGRRCVAELVQELPVRVYPIGRLDRNSEGVLLLTNDGAFANGVMHPRYHISKTYRVTVRPDINDDQLTRLAAGIELDGRMTLPAQVTVLSKEPGRVVLQIVIEEGRNRQVRRMCEAVGLEVARLKRTAVGPVRLGMLEPGHWRDLTPAELGAFWSMLGGEEGAPQTGRRAASAEAAVRHTQPAPEHAGHSAHRAAHGTGVRGPQPGRRGRSGARPDEPAYPSARRNGRRQGGR